MTAGLAWLLWAVLAVPGAVLLLWAAVLAPFVTRTRANVARLRRGK